jgi:hypothetical protein
MPKKGQDRSASIQDNGGAPQVSLIFTNEGVQLSLAILHDDETFDVQWIAVNDGPATSNHFTDLLIVEALPEGCPGSDDRAHEVVFDSRTDADPRDMLEPRIPPGQSGPLMKVSVGPFQAGYYRFRVTLASIQDGLTASNCVEVIARN